MYKDPNQSWLNYSKYGSLRNPGNPQNPAYWHTRSKWRTKKGKSWRAKGYSYNPTYRANQPEVKYSDTTVSATTTNTADDGYFIHLNDIDQGDSNTTRS